MERTGEQGNIVLIAALIVLGLGLSGLGLTRLLQIQLSQAGGIRRSGFAGTFAQNVAESLINQQLFTWNTQRGIPLGSLQLTQPGTASFSLTTNYSSYSVNTTVSTYSIAYNAAAWTASTNSLVASVSVLTPDWGKIERVVTAVIASRSSYVVEEYRR